MGGKRKIYFFVLLVIINYGTCIPRLDPLVQTKVGLIRGLRASDGNYSMFLGIPYATVNETNPFGPSIPHPDFKETFEAYDDTAICPQIEEFNNTVVGTLDCLHLNVYVPNNANSNNKLPVLAWIYGGGFSIGFAGRYLYGPKYLVRHDVILVTLNYRVGPYGFMCLDSPEVPGNQGLKDQLIALKWIKNNIESFGGDSNQITIFGESAGGMSVDLHLHSEEDNLYHKVIMQSGTALLNDLISEPNSEPVFQIAKQLGFETDDLSSVLSFLASSDPHLVIAATSEAKASFGACIERNFENTERFVSDYTVNKKVPKAKNIQILLGFNSDETISIYANEPEEYFENLNVFNDYLKMNFNFNNETLSEVHDIVQHFYIGDEKLSANQMRGIVNFNSDILFNHPTIRSINRYLENEAKDVYFYVFSYNGERNFVKRKNNFKIGGASHADELGYLFDITYWKEEPTYEDQIIIDRMTEMWTNFAKYGNPTPETSDLIPVIWEPVKKDTPLYYMNIDSQLELKTRPFKERLTFWDLLFKSYWTSQRGYRAIPLGRKYVVKPKNKNGKAFSTIIF